MYLREAPFSSPNEKQEKKSATAQRQAPKVQASPTGSDPARPERQQSTTRHRRPARPARHVHRGEGVMPRSSPLRRILRLSGRERGQCHTADFRFESSGGMHPVCCTDACLAPSSVGFPGSAQGCRLLIMSEHLAIRFFFGGFFFWVTISSSVQISRVEGSMLRLTTLPKLITTSAPLRSWRL